MRELVIRINSRSKFNKVISDIFEFFVIDIMYGNDKSKDVLDVMEFVANEMNVKIPLYIKRRLLLHTTNENLVQFMYNYILSTEKLSPFLRSFRG